jgi:mitochondrial fission protein ELM1
LSASISSCWVVTDGNAGQESQCVGLAEALGIMPVIKRVTLREPWRLLSPYLRAGLAHAVAERLTRPWPELVIASGRLSVPASLFVKAQSRRAGQPCFTIQIQDPVIASRHFDLVIAPLHDSLTGPNVISTLGSLHRIVPEKLSEGAKDLSARITGLAPPYIGVLIGGTSAAYRLGNEQILALARQLKALAGTAHARLLVTPSRRTGKHNLAILREALSDTPAFIWNEDDANPYFGILGLSDALVVTADSVNMITEACATGKPVYIFDIPGGSAKSSRFRETLLARGHARKFTAPLEPYAPQPLREMERVAAEIKRRLAEPKLRIS